MITDDEFRSLWGKSVAIKDDVKVALKLAKGLGLKVILQNMPPEIQAQRGRIIVLSDSDPEEVVSNICHEVAHWLVSAPERRHLPNYGLGQSPDDSLLGGLTMPLEEAFAEEARASLLGVLIERYSVGCAPQWTLRVHSWVDFHDPLTAPVEERPLLLANLKQMSETLQVLREQGHVDGFKPTYRLGVQ
jgi:hypothetical protein